MSEVIDLDALIPQQVFIKFDNEQIEVPPPKTGQLLKLGSLGQKLQNVDSLSTEEINSLVTQLSEQVFACVPQLVGKELNTAQLLKLVEIISNMAIPPEAKELEKRGITPDTPKETA